MSKRRKILLYLVLTTVVFLAVSLVVSCGSKNDKNGSTTVTYTSSEQAAKSTSSANAAVDLSQSMNSAAADLTSSSPDNTYKTPGINSSTDTSSLSAIDPQLQVFADGMLGQMKSAAVTNTISKARAMRSAGLASAPSPTHVTITGTCSGGTGTFTITGTDTSTVTYKEYTIDIVLETCSDSTNTVHSVSNGSIHVYDKEMLDNSSSNRVANIHLTALDYDGATLKKTKIANGDFTANESGTSTSRSGSNSANGSYSEIVPGSGGGNQVGTFYFTNLGDQWTWDIVSNVKTVTNTMNGSFGYSIVSPTGSLKLDIALTNLQDKVRYNNYLDPLFGSRDRWINGSITITWSPDLSLYGCIGGTITYTTAVATPLHYVTSLAADKCPASGTLVINNATIVYGNPIVVTVGNDQKTFATCSQMDNNGLCGGNN